MALFSRWGRSPAQVGSSKQLHRADSVQEGLTAECDSEVFDKLHKRVAAPQFLRTLESAKLRLQSQDPNEGMELSFQAPQGYEQDVCEPTAAGSSSGTGQQHQASNSGPPTSLTPSASSSSTAAATINQAEDYVIVDKDDAVEALAHYIAVCIYKLPEAQNMTPKQLQLAVKDAVKGLRASKFKKLCSWGRSVYRWSAMSYSCLQLYNNPWLVRAIIGAMWAFSRFSMGALW